MDHGHFDAMTRSVGDGGTRRAIFRLLAVGALGGLAARLGLPDVTAAKGKKPEEKNKKKRPAPAERLARGQLQAEGKRKGKKGRGKKKPKNPRPDEPCSVDKYRCSDGACVPWDTCCAGEKRCSNKSGPRCIPAQSCCPDERSCSGDDTCVAAGECCPAERECADGECHPGDGCCPEEKLCFSTCIPKELCCHADPFPLCGPCDEVVCDRGSYVCRPRSDLKPCPDGSCVAPDACCPDDQPQCGSCEVLACENGHSVCKPITQECPGGEWDPARCRCKYCEETCDSVTKMCHSNCPDGHQCVEGQCLRVCSNPSKPQLCCKENRPGWVECACAPANAKCHPCMVTTGACWCLPGQTCCSPEELPVCPQACLAAEICQE